MIGQHAIVPPPVTTNPQQVGHPGAPVSVTRIPLAVDPLSSPSHPNSGVALVRPVPQQPSPVRVHLLVGLLFCFDLIFFAFFLPLRVNWLLGRTQISFSLRI